MSPHNHTTTKTGMPISKPLSVVENVIAMRAKTICQIPALVFPPIRLPIPGRGKITMFRSKEIIAIVFEIGTGF